MKRPQINAPAVSRSNHAGVIIAFIIYTSVAVYLYQPYLGRFRFSQYLIPLNSVIAATGCFVLSRRWLSTSMAAVCAGAVYGFSPLLLGFGAYHPAAGLPAAAVPWLFCPAVLWNRGREQTAIGIVSAVLFALLPFICIIGFFQFCLLPAFGPFYPLPLHTRLTLSSLAGLAVPLSVNPPELVFSIYHIPLAVGLMGFLMYLNLHRVKVVIPAVAGFILSFAQPVFQVSPVVWACVPLLYCSVLAGAGIEGIAFAGQADRKWLVICMGCSAAVAAFALAAGYAFDFGIAWRQAGRMHLLGFVLMASIYFMAKAQVRWRLLRWTLLLAGVGIDVIAGARLLVDMIQ